jgi:hypothetical protein
MRSRLFLLIALSIFSVCAFTEDKAQGQAAPEGDTVCTFGNGQQISIRYPEVTFSKGDLPRGKVWTPDNRPMYLFSQSELAFGSTKVPPGAYSLYAIPGDQNWTLVVNKGVEQGQAYDPSKDLAKMQAETAKLPSTADKLILYFGRIAPDKCTLRIDYGKQRAFADFAQK